MQNKRRKLLAFLLCLALVFSLAGFAIVREEDNHEHSYESEALNAVLASPMVTTFSSDLVPLGAGEVIEPEADSAQGEDDTPSHEEVTPPTENPPR